MGMSIAAQGQQVECCPRIPVKQIMNDKVQLLPIRFMEALEQNQKIASCCRHPENHDIIAQKSHPDEKAPDIYKFICTCGRVHTRFMMGDAPRPFWDRK